MYVCRQRIQAINEELQNFIGLMTDDDVEDGEVSEQEELAIKVASDPWTGGSNRKHI